MKTFFLFTYFPKAKDYFSKHKIIGSIIFIGLTLLSYNAYGYLFGTTTETNYVFTKVEKGTLISSISGTGQIFASDQIDIKPKASGDIVWLDLKVGQNVYAGQALATIDNTDAKKVLADAETSLNEARLNFEKAQAQAPLDYDNKLESLSNQEDDLIKKYEDSFNTVSNIFLDTPGIVTGLQKILYGDELDLQKSWNIDYYKNMFEREDRELIISLVEIAVKDYISARAAYDINFTDFKNLTRYSEQSKIESILEQTLITTKLIAQAAKSQNNLLDTILDINEKYNYKTNSTITTFKSNIKSYLGTTNSQLSSLLSQTSSLSSLKQAIANSKREIDIMKINNPTGSNPISLQISLNSLKKKEADLADLRATLSDYTIRAPFTGIIAKVNIKKGDSVSTGTAIATIITKQKIAEITLNEVDMSMVKLGQKSTLVFDAIEDLNISGRVSEVDTIGTVSQGVVTYNLKISLDTQDDRIKPGMSVSVSIITQAKPDALIIPSSAIKTQNNISYVELFEKSSSSNKTTTDTPIAVTPTQRNVEVGISNDTQTEILSGLSEGEEIILRTTTSTTKTTTKNSSSAIKIPGLGGATRQGGSVTGSLMR